MRLYYFYEKNYNELFIFYRFKGKYVYQNYLDYINNDPWRYVIYPYYKITSVKQLEKEIKKINKADGLNYKRISKAETLDKIIRGLGK